MGVRYYFDVHVRRAVSEGLRLRGVDVLTAQEDGGGELGDAELMDRARELGRVVFTQDRDFLVEANRRQQSGETFVGVIYAHQLKVTIGQCVADLELIANVYEPADMADRIEYLPLN